MAALENMWQKVFSHIYIEKKAYEHELTLKIISMFKDAVKIDINHYKDIFCRHGQSFTSQKKSPKLILAVRRDSFFYKGSDMCDSYGNENFYYSSHVMNCLYDCEYCYLQGMYNSAYIVIFVNIDDYFKRIPKDSYICISYDSDLLSLEYMTGFLRKWIDVCRCSDVTVEVRTKSANFFSIADIKCTENVILSWTVSPDEIIKRFEHRTPDLKMRLKSVQSAIENGWKVRLCIDPVICVDEFAAIYSKLAREVSASVEVKKLMETSIGLYRVPKKFSKKILDLRMSEASVYEFDDSTNDSVLNLIYDIFYKQGIKCRF